LAWNQRPDFYKTNVRILKCPAYIEIVCIAYELSNFSELFSKFVSDMNGNTALHHAARNVHVRLVQLLCSRGADVSIRNKQGIQARGVKPWDGKRGWNTTPERWSQETKDAVRDIKNALQEAFNKQRMKKELEQREIAEAEAKEDRNERIRRRVIQAKEKEKEEIDGSNPMMKKDDSNGSINSSPVSLIPQRMLAMSPPPSAPTPPPVAVLQEKVTFKTGFESVCEIPVDK
jgi:hypothetical protein